MHNIPIPATDKTHLLASWSFIHLFSFLSIIHFETSYCLLHAIPRLLVVYFLKSHFYFIFASYCQPYTVKKGQQYSRLQPGCHLPNSTWPGKFLTFLYSVAAGVWCLYFRYDTMGSSMATHARTLCDGPLLENSWRAECHFQVAKFLLHFYK